MNQYLFIQENTLETVIQISRFCILWNWIAAWNSPQRCIFISKCIASTHETLLSFSEIIYPRNIFCSNRIKLDQDKIHSLGLISKISFFILWIFLCLTLIICKQSFLTCTFFYLKGLIAETSSPVAISSDSEEEDLKPKGPIKLNLKNNVDTDDGLDDPTRNYYNYLNKYKEE